MKIVKIDFEDFKLAENDNFELLKALEEAQLAEANKLSAETLEFEEAKPEEFEDYVDTDALKKESYDEGYLKAKQEYDINLVEQNQQIEKLLIQIRTKLNVIEEVQTNKINETIDSISEYLELLIRKLVKEPQFKKIIINKVMDSITAVLSKVKGYGSVCVEVSNSLGESMLGQVKSYLEKNNMSNMIELKTSDREDVVVSWNGGEAKIDSTKTIEEINQELHRLDTTT